MNTLILLYLLVGLIVSLTLTFIEVKGRFYLEEEVEVTLLDLGIVILMLFSWPLVLIIYLCLEIFGYRTLFRIKRRSKQ